MIPNSQEHAENTSLEICKYETDIHFVKYENITSVEDIQASTLFLSLLKVY